MVGKLVILSGPSGVGKDTVLQIWAERNPAVKRVIAFTTRKPRPGEQDGVDYHFVDARQFEAKARRGEFLEHKLVHGNYYATPIDEMDAIIREGRIAVLKIDVQGALTAMERRPEALSIFLLPPSREELRRRLSARGTEDKAEVERRLQEAERELAEAPKYGYRVVNDEIERVIDLLQNIVSISDR